MKNIILIRHGESLGQVAKARGRSRKHPDLLDCFITQKGIGQASQLKDSIQNIDLVCTSPLTRAITTCALAFGNIADQELEEEGATITTPFICHPDLAEVGSSIPENMGRPIKKVLKDIKRTLPYCEEISCLDKIDFSLLPKSWPDIGKPKSLTNHSLMNFLEWLNSRPETNIVVVCHYNVIIRLLNRAVNFVENCSPILCTMNEDDLTLHLVQTKNVNFN